MALSAHTRVVCTVEMDVAKQRNLRVLTRTFPFILTIFFDKIKTGLHKYFDVC